MNFSVCIPTLNAGKQWPSFLVALKRQSVRPSEVLVLDSSSTDGTPDLAQQDGCRVITIPREAFRHGETRQIAAESSKGSELLVYLTQDAILVDANALFNLVAAFEDASIGAAYGRQLPRPGANAIEAHARSFNYPSESEIRSLESKHSMGFKAAFFSNSFGAYRRVALEQVGGFPRESNFGEDTVVAARLLLSGWKIAYVADAQAYHSHDYSCAEELRRYYGVGRLHATETWLLSDFGRVAGEGIKFVASEFRHLWAHSPWLIPEATLRSVLKYLGYKWGLHSPRP